MSAAPTYNTGVVYMGLSKAIDVLEFYQYFMEFFLFFPIDTAKGSWRDWYEVTKVEEDTLLVEEEVLVMEIDILGSRCGLTSYDAFSPWRIIWVFNNLRILFCEIANFEFSSISSTNHHLHDEHLEC